MMDTMKTFGRFNVRVLLNGESYGLADCLVHDKLEPLVEFYDVKHQQVGEWARGQFVSRYYLTTLLDRPPSHVKCDLSLVGYEPAWTVKAYQMKKIMRWIKSLKIKQGA